MSITLDSHDTPPGYMSVAELLKRVDVRLIADLVSDSGARTGSSTDTAAMAAALASNANLLAVMFDACGQVEGALLRSKRFRQTDLATIVASDTAATARLYRLLTRITVCLLWERRADKGELPKSYKQGLEELERIEQGVDILGVLEHEDAGLVASRQLGVSDPIQANSILRRASRYFGARRWVDETFPPAVG